MQDLQHVVGPENALDRLRRLERMADDDLVVGYQLALLEQHFQPGEPDLVVAHGQIFGRIAVLARKAPHVDVPAARHAHGHRHREGAPLPFFMKHRLVGLRLHRAKAVLAAKVLPAVHVFLPSFRPSAKRESRNPYSAALGLWIPGSRPAVAPRNDNDNFISNPSATSAGRCRSSNRASPARRAFPRSSPRRLRAASG